MANEGEMDCPECGVKMNRHAEKLDYSEAPASPGSADPDLGGVLAEFHTCPACGTTHARRAEGGA